MNPSTPTEHITFPSNIQAEEEVLASCLLDPESADGFMDALRPEHFYPTAHQKIFGAILRLREAGNPVDVAALASELRKSGDLETAGGAPYLSKLLDIPLATSVEYFAGLVRDAYLRRKVIENGYAIVKDAQRPEVAACDLLGASVARLTRIEDGSLSACAESLAGLCLAACDRYEALHGASGRIVGIPWGFRELDALTCGLQPGELVILAARPSMGKTALALNMARHAASAGYPVGFFSLEMGKGSLVDRLISSAAGVNGLKFRNGRFSPEDWDRIAGAQVVLSELPIFIDDTPGMHHGEVRRRARRMVRDHGIKVFFIDYLQLLAGDRQGGRVEEVSSISRNLKGIARELNVSVVCLSQLSRSCESRDNKRPRLSDLRDSGAIEQDADVVAFIYRDEVYTRGTPACDVAEIDIGKQRNGPTGTIRLRFHARTTSFWELGS